MRCTRGFSSLHPRWRPKPLNKLWPTQTSNGSVLKPGARDLLRFEQTQGMLRNILSPRVPLVAAQNVKEVLQRVLGQAKLDRSQIAAWILHPGGRDVLLAMRKELDLGGQDLRWSEAVLAQYGNLSSPSVFFVLQAALRDAAPSGFWWMASFGAGFSSHGALLKVDKNRKNVALLADLEMHASPTGYVGFCRLGDGEVNVCGLFRQSADKPALPQPWTDALRGQPGTLLWDRLADAVFERDSCCSVAGLSLRPGRAVSRSECCIGDAITMIPPVTGNGMSMAFEAA